MELLESIDHYLGNHEAGVLLVVGGEDVPGSLIGARRGEAVLVSLHISVPRVALGDVGHAELPVLLRLVDTSEEAPCLLLRGDVEEELDDAGAVYKEMALLVNDRSKALLPD